MHTAEKQEQKPQIQESCLKQTDAQKSAPTSQEQHIDIIQLSSDDEQTVTAITTSKTISNISAPSDNSVLALEQRIRSRTRSRSSSSSSLSSTLSSSYRSLDYEAEADEEDANECEGVELQRKLAGGNDNLMHVQNFLNCFDKPQQGRRQQKATIQPDEQQQQQMLQEKHRPSDEINRFEPSVCVDLSKVYELTTHNQNDGTGIATAVAEANETEEMPTTSSAVTTKASNKPCKFTISTKFLRKPRHKLKSVNITPAADVSKTLTTTTTSIGKLQESQEKQQYIAQQQQRQPAEVDEPNVKFNSNFSISSLLNKR